MRMICIIYQQSWQEDSHQLITLDGIEQNSTFSLKTNDILNIFFVSLHPLERYVLAEINVQTQNLLDNFINIQQAFLSETSIKELHYDRRYF